MRHLTFVLFSVCLAWLPASAQPALDDHQIIAGQRIGPLSVGMAITDAVAAMGTPKSTSTHQKSVYYYWFENVILTETTSRRDYGLYAAANSLGKIFAIATHYDPRYSTPSGLRVGMKEAQVRTAMGFPLNVIPIPGPSGRQTGHVLEYTGIWFLVVDDPEIKGYQTLVEIGVVPSIFRPIGSKTERSPD